MGVEGRLRVYGGSEGLQSCDDLRPLGGIEKEGADEDRLVLRHLRISCWRLPQCGLDPVGWVIGPRPQHAWQTGKSPRPPAAHDEAVVGSVAVDHDSRLTEGVLLLLGDRTLELDQPGRDRFQGIFAGHHQSLWKQEPLPSRVERADVEADHARIEKLGFSNLPIGGPNGEGPPGAPRQGPVLDVSRGDVCTGGGAEAEDKRQDEGGHEAHGQRPARLDATIHLFPPKLPLSPGKAAEEQHTYTLNLISRQGIWRGGGERNSTLLSGVPPRPRRAVSNVTLWFSQRRPSQVESRRFLIRAGQSQRFGLPEESAHEGDARRRAVGLAGTV